MPDSAGGREVEIEAVARVMMRDYTGIPWDDLTTEQRGGWLLGAENAIAALDAVRGTGPAARNQEERWVECEDPTNCPADTLRMMVADLEAEVERLREALAAIAERRWNVRPGPDVLVQQFAREAFPAARSPQSEDQER